jgi:hypothetical protein
MKQQEDATMTHATPGSPLPRSSFVDRLVRVCRLDPHVFEEVEHDPSALPQAAGVIALAAFAQGVVAFPVLGVLGVLGAVLGAFLGWLAATAVIWLIGVRLMGHTSDYVELLRTLGFASVPQILLILGVLPLGPLFGVLQIVVGVLLLISFVVAVRQALDVSTLRALVVCVLSILVQALLISLIPGVLPGVGAVTQPGAIPAP